jgi:mono/diheme cytochrome c family protein
MRSSSPILRSSIIASALLLLAPLTRADEAAAVEREFSLKVLPLLKEKCLACHGDDPKKIKGELNMLTREGLLKGGEESDKVLVPGHAEESQMFVAVTWQNENLEMPPKENDRLKPEQIELLRRWIDGGAPWPDAVAQQKYREAEWAVESNEDGVILKTSGGLADEWTDRRYKPENVWAFQPVVKPAVPGEAANPIDAFIDAKRSAAGYEAAAEADPRTLIRRATLDLIGLPPTPTEISDFEAASTRDAEQAWSALIDRLLANPHYGERWGQHWLDVVRYADTGGYSNDYERSNAWRYRDYVIRAFNEDKPYDRFVLEQLAGDELADISLRQRKAPEGYFSTEESEWVVATGFLRMGPWDDAMVKAPESRQMYLDDVVNSVGQSFLATTMRCFKCHDHKFDPLPTKDYYRLYATFAATQMAERPAPLLPDENLARFEEGKAHVQRMLAFATREKNALVERRESAARAWFKEHNLEYKDEQARKDLPDEEKPPRAVGLDHIAEGQLKVREQDEWIWNRALERYEPMAQTVYNGPDTGKNARKLRMEKQAAQPNWRPKSVIYTGGSIEAPGAPVDPGVLSALGVPVEGSPADDPYKLPDSLDGRRLALAKWVADPRNPLTSRAFVNRVWQHHFVKPIAGNPNNFGAKGSKPTHPELLDWLAADFVENGWTVKRLHRLIMTSRAYRQGTSHPRMEELRVKDADNHLLAYFPPRRLTAEELRDNLLAISGELNPMLGGLPIMPEINMEVALQPRMIQFSIAPAHQPSTTPEERNRRSIYAYRVRGQADPFLEIFNQPNPNDSCEERDSAAVSPQVFTLMNSDVITDRSIALALRLEKEADTIEKQVEKAFQLTLGRAPDAAENERLTAYVNEMRTYHAGVAPKPVTYPTEITRSLVEEFSGKPFEYQEILPAFENYQPDKKPADVSPETRALADLCVVLFNSNEFLFVY